MQRQQRSGESDVDVTIPTLEQEAVEASPLPRPRRQILRALSGVAMGAMVLIGLASCGGEDGEGNGNGAGDEDEEEDD